MSDQITTNEDTKPPSDPPAGQICGAASCSACDGCRWQKFGEGESWCYMFEESPENLPCAQHDDFEGQRQATSMLFKRNPTLFNLAVMGMIEEAKIQPNAEGQTIRPPQ